jgi:hypothetical protein
MSRVLGEERSAAIHKCAGGEEGDSLFRAGVASTLAMLPGAAGNRKSCTVLSSCERGALVIDRGKVHVTVPGEFSMLLD